MLAGINRRLEVDRAEARRRGQQHDVHAAVNHLLVGVQAHEALLGRDFDLVRVRLLQALQALLQLVLERVAHRGEDDVRVGIERLAGGAGAAPAAADQPDAEGAGVFPGRGEIV